MSLRSILVLLDPSANPEAVLQVGVRLASQHGARLIGLPAVAKRTEEAVENAGTLERAFREQATRGQLSHEWSWATGHQEESLVLTARAHDLLVMGQAPPRGARLWPQSDSLLERALIKSGHGVIAVPPQGSFPSVGERVLVAWSGARAAARAVEDAMPILEKAKEVTLLTTDLRSGDALSVDPLAATLERHEVNVAVRGARLVDRSAMSCSRKRMRCAAISWSWAATAIPASGSTCSAA